MTAQRVQRGHSLVIVTAIVLIGLVPGSGVMAHGKLQRAEPVPDSTVKTAPKVVRMWFTLGDEEELDPKRSAISVWDARGRRVDDAKGGVDLDDLDRKSMIARLKPLNPGTYTVRWKAVSTPDGNVAQGEFRFTVVRSAFWR